MLNLLPVLILGAIIGILTLNFGSASLAMKSKTGKNEFQRNMTDAMITRRLRGYAKAYIGQFVLVFFIMILSIAYELLSPVIVGEIQELVKVDFQLRTLYFYVAVYAGILVVSLVSTYLQTMILQKVGQKILSDLREDVFTHIESLSHEQLNNIPVGKLVTRVTNDTNGICMLFTNVLVTMVRNFMIILGVFATMLTVNIAMTLVVTCFIPFVILFTVIFQKFSRKAHKKHG